MEKPLHTLSELFAQLGLPETPEAIDAFVARHRPLPHGMALADAPFWSPSQAAFLREELAEDADWAELVDTLAEMLAGD